MVYNGGGSAPDGDPASRRGWRLPDDVTGGQSGPPPLERRPPDRPRAAPAPLRETASTPPATLPQGVAGLARGVAVTSVQSPNGTQTTVVTFRLEQHDARAGRTGVVTVRLFGEQALGFAADGDWVEVTGKVKDGFLKAAHAVNHTTQAQYSRSGHGVANVVAIIAFCLVVLFILSIGISILLDVVRQ